MEEFSANGYNDTTLSAIATRACTTTAAVYYHFDRKLAVLAELLGEIGSSMDAALETDEPAQSVQGLFVDSYSGFAAWVNDHPRESLLWFGRSAGIAPEIEQVRRVWTSRVAGRARDAVSGLHPRIDRRMASVIGLALPVLLEEYARFLLHDPAAGRPAKLRQLHASVIAMAGRLDVVARAPTRRTKDLDK